MRLSIRYQLFVPLTLLIIGLLAICGWSAYSSAEQARIRIARQMDGVAQTLRDGTYPLSAHVLEQMKGLSGAEYILIDAQGEPAGTSGVADARVSIGQTASGSFLDQRIQIGNTRYLYQIVVLRPTHPNAGSQLFVLYPESLLRDAVWQAVKPPLFLGVGGGLAAILLTLVIGHQLVRRLGDLERRTRVIAAGDFSPMPLPGRNDELRDLAQSVNEMAEKLAQLQDAIRRTEHLRLLGQVASGLAHQLRNGVTGAQLAVQLHERSCAGGDVDALHVAVRQLTRVAADLQSFFELGRDDVRREVCSLPDLVGDAVELLLPQCRHAQVTLEWSAPDASCPVYGEPGRLGHLVFNLIANAVEAASPSGAVEVLLQETDGGQLRLEVCDTGPGPPPEIASRLFEPFVTGKPEGIGLGLAVAKEVAEAHGGRIGWQRIADRTCFWVQLPSSRQRDVSEQKHGNQATVAH